MKTPVHLSWNNVHFDTINALGKLRTYGNIDELEHVIIGVSRGGLVPALVASHQRHWPLRVIHASTYDGEESTGAELHVGRDVLAFADKKVLVVDDIYDTGKTVTMIKEILPKAVFLMPYSKVEKPGPDIYYGKLYDADTWVEFPWESRI